MSNSPRGWMAHAYARLLRLYPARYRKAWTGGMQATFERRAREMSGAGWPCHLRFVVREFGSLLIGIARERLAALWRSGAPGGDFPQDVRFAARSLASTPTFSGVAVVTLTLGIGATSAMFSIVDAVVLRPLPYPEPERIMRVWETSGDWLRNPASAANYLDWRDESTSFEHLAAYTSTSMTLTGAGEPLRIAGVRVSGEFFDVLGVPARAGRAVSAGDDDAAAGDVVVLGHALWRQRFGAAEAVVGTDISLDGRPHTVVGVMPEGFEYPRAGTRFWAPMAFTPEEAARRNWRNLSMVGRLADGATPDSALAELRSIAARLAAEYPDANEGVDAHLVPLREELVGPARATLLSVLAAIAFVLLIACTNVATLMLTRGTARRGEVAVRAALGAGRWRIVRQLATESLLLALVAGGLALVLAAWSIGFLAALVPARLPLSVPVTLDLRVTAFTLLLALSTTGLSGLIPALHATRSDLAGELRGGRATTARAQQGLRAALVAGEVALATVLLVGAGLMLRSFATLMAEDPGFDGEGALRVRIGLTAERYADPEARGLFHEELLAEARTLPGVRHAALTTSVPLGMSGGALIYTPEGQPTRPQDATFRVVSEGYFAALGIGLQGRDFTSGDDREAPPVVIVGRELARRAWPGEDARGKRLKLGDEDSSDPWRTVIGVADDVRQWDLELEARPAIYVPFRQAGTSFAPQELVLETTGSPASLAGPARRLVAAIDADIPVSVQTMADLVATASAARRFNMQIFGAFGLVALLLASIGLYGVVAHAVAHRTREIGIRMALGARRGSVVVMLLRYGALLVGAGIALGLLGGIGAARVLETLLYGIDGVDGLTFAVVFLGLALVGAVATLVPARRASAIEPVIALRRE